ALAAWISIGSAQNREGHDLAEAARFPSRPVVPLRVQNPLESDSPRSESGISLVEMLHRVERHYQIHFVFDDALVKGKTTFCPPLTSPLPVVLKKILTEHGLTYQKIGKSTYVLQRIIRHPKSPRAGNRSGSIRGILRDSDGQILVGANVTIDGTPYGACTDTDGVYTISNVPPGYYTVKALYMGYKTAQKTVFIPPGHPATVNFRLAEDILQMEPVEVTARRRPRFTGETPVRLTMFGDEEIQPLAPNSLADVLRSLPGIHAEGGGGEVAANIFVRGLPATGQYKYNPIEEDGMPVISTGGITASAPDIFFRYDLNVEQLDFARGGVATLFGVGSPTGIINYRSKTGGSRRQTSLQLTTGEPDLYRLDYNTGGPLGNHWRYNVGGFFRYDEGPVVTGLPTRGFQMKGNLTRLFRNGFLRLHGKYLDDRVQFFLPFPHDSHTRRPAPGDDGREIHTLNSPEATRFQYRTPRGIFDSHMENGVLTRGPSVMLEFMYKPVDRWEVEGRVRWSRMAHEFNIFIPFPAYYTAGEFAYRKTPGPDGIAGTADDVPLFITDPARQRPLYRFTYHPETPFTGEHVITQGAWHRNRPFEDLAADVRFLYTHKTLPGRHKVTLGTFLARTMVDQFEVYNSLLMEFADRPRVLDLFIWDAGPDGRFATADDDTLPITHGGIANAVSGLGTVYINNRIVSRKMAVYAADRMYFSPRLELEAGFRIEQQSARLQAEGVQAVTVAGQEVPALQGFQWGNGKFYHRTVHFRDIAATVGLNYRLLNGLTLYGFANRGYFFPEIQALTGNLGRDSTGAFRPFHPPNERFYQVEGGLQYEGGEMAFSLSLFHSRILNRLQTDPQQGEDGVVRNITRMIRKTTTRGLELTSRWDLPMIRGVHVQGNLTLQDHRYGDYPITTVGPDGVIGTRDDTPANYRGNAVRRQPGIMAGGRLAYRGRRLDFTAGIKYLGKRFADDGNILELHPFTLLTLDAGYRLFFWRKQVLRIGVHVFNALNSHGLTEGDPRLPPGADPLKRRYFNARPILPRRITFKLSFYMQ
ncbi:MAG: TonB-dependent receptor, partial [Calditrichaeota bacterium]